MATILLLCSSLWPGFSSPNERARVYASRALVERGSWIVDDEVRAFGLIDDLSVVDGHYVANKHPGLTWIAVPLLRGQRALLGDRGPLFEQWFLRLGTVSLSALLALAVLWRQGSTEGALLRGDEAAVLLFAATPWGLYSALFFSHAFVGALLLFAFLLGESARGGNRPLQRAAAAGLLGGLAVACELQSAPVAGLTVLIGVGPALRRLAAAGAAAALPLLGLAWHQHGSYGSILTPANRFDLLPGYRELHQQSLVGFSWPTADSLLGLGVSPLLGLFFFSPFLLPLVAAPWVLTRGGQRRERALSWTLGGGFLLLACYGNWHGGAVLGARYLVFLLPLGMLLMTRFPAGAGLRRIVLTLGLAAGALNLVCRAVPPFAIDDVWWASTLRGWVLPALGSGWIQRPWVDAPFGLSLATLGVVAALQLALLAILARRLPRPWLGAGAAAALVLALFAVGAVTERQQRWLEVAGPWFTAAESRR